jgi:CheY-like chemotaxis protein
MENTALKVMIIDDDEVNNFVAQKLIDKTKLPVQIEFCENGRTALDSLIQYCNQDTRLLPDCIFVDLTMPVMNGWAFLEEFDMLPFQALSNCKLYVVTSSILKSDEKYARQFKQVDGFVQKPVSVDTLGEIFSGALSYNTVKTWPENRFN